MEKEFRTSKEVYDSLLVCKECICFKRKTYCCDKCAYDKKYEFPACVEQLLGDAAALLDYRRKVIKALEGRK